MDRLCQIANFEREYMQLHRDSTVGQLTLSPSLVNGKIIWNDSPLVRSIRDGYSLVLGKMRLLKSYIFIQYNMYQLTCCIKILFR